VSSRWHRDRSGAPVKPGSCPIIRFPAANRNRTSAARAMEGSTRRHGAGRPEYFCQVDWDREDKVGREE
jgi:hypothetical protein